MNRAQTGRWGERRAELYYRLRGYRIEARNFRTRQGEIDLIARKGDTLVFIEVKTRGANAIAAPCEAVGHAKQRRLLLAAGAYLAMRGEDCFTRFDVVEVSAGRPFGVHCIENAFEA